MGARTSSPEIHDLLTTTIFPDRPTSSQWPMLWLVCSCADLHNRVMREKDLQQRVHSTDRRRRPEFRRAT